MAFDPWALKPKGYRAHVRTFDTEDGKFTLTLRRLSTPEATLAFERGEEMVETYITGNADEGKPPSPFPLLGGEPVRISETLLRNAAAIEMMQPPGAPERYSAEEIVALSAGLDPDVWMRVTKFVKEVSGGGSDTLKNALSGGAENSSSPRSEPGDGTHSLITKSPPSSGASTSDSDGSQESEAATA